MARQDERNEGAGCKGSGDRRRCVFVLAATMRRHDAGRRKRKSGRKEGRSLGTWEVREGRKGGAGCMGGEERKGERKERVEYIGGEEGWESGRKKGKKDLGKRERRGRRELSAWKERRRGHRRRRRGR